MSHPGLRHALSYPLFQAVLERRSRRISKGIGKIRMGSLTYESGEPPEPVTPLEEALLILATGITGMTMPDSPFEDASGHKILGSPLLELRGRAASSPDNAQATHFFMVNDTGTYLLRQPDDLDLEALRFDSLDEAGLVALAETCKRKVLDHRLDFPRVFPAYMDRNRQISNVPGSTVFIPVVDMTRQYINAIMYLLAQPEGQRPTFIDDWNFYRKAGVGKWVRSGFLNKDIKVPLGVAGTMRTPYEALLLLQNLMLAIQAIGLGGWIHAAAIPAILMGDPDFTEKYGRGLGFRYVKPKRTVLRMLRIPITPLPAWRANPVGLPGILEGFCPPHYRTMADAVDAVIDLKYGPAGLYKDPKNYEPVFKDDKAATFLAEVPHYTPDVIACAKDVCTYIYETYGRFPAHCDAMHAPGVCVQAHVTDLAFYDSLYRNGYTASQALHEQNWSQPGEGA